MGVMKKFLEGLDWTKLRRDDDFLLSKPADPNALKAMAAVATDGSFAVVYVPDAMTTSVAPNFGKLSFKPSDMDVTSIDPADGKPMAHISFSGGCFVFAAGKELKDDAGNVVFRTKDWVFLIRKKRP
jgi:hypothetical protein